jgi:hypothetical protein
MFLRHHGDKLIYPLFVIGLVVFVSYRPTYRLRTEMPPFFGLAQTAADKNSPQSKIAAAYWHSALTDVQWKYPHGHPLPTDPPVEFHADAKSLGPIATDSGVRSLYWRRLQQVWMAPEAWTQHYEWDWGWTNDPFTAISEWLHETADRWLRTHAPN